MKFTPQIKWIFLIVGLTLVVLSLLILSIKNSFVEFNKVLANANTESVALAQSDISSRETASDSAINPSRPISDVTAADAERRAMLDELVQIIGPGSGERDQNKPPIPYLLADYAAQCKAYMGTVPEFSCTTLIESTMETLTVIAVDKSRHKCPLIPGVDKECNINTTTEGILRSSKEGVTILFSCRVYDHLNQSGRYDDIAVIQHDTNTGNTCWFNSPTVPELDAHGNVQKDQDGNIVYKDFDGTLVPSPMASGAESFWLHPYQPDDTFTPTTDGSILLEDLRQGKRGIMADKNCQRCHDADPFIWTPFLESIHIINNTSSPRGWDPLGSYVSNFLGIFNADGVIRTQALRLALDASIPEWGDCTFCHQLGEFTMRPDTPESAVNDKQVVPLLDTIFTDTLRNVVWMPPTSSTGHPALSLTTKNKIQDCAKSPSLTGCNSRVPPPDKRVGLIVFSKAEPDILLGGHEVRYSISLANTQGPYTNTVENLSVSNSLPPGVSLVSTSMAGSFGASDACASTSSAEATTLHCSIQKLAYGERITLTVTGLLNSSGAKTLTNTVRVTAPDTFNIGSTPADAIKLENVNAVRRDADLVLSQETSLQPIIETTPISFMLKLKLKVINQGPATASSILLTGTLPADAIFDANLSSLDCNASANIVHCKLDELADGANSTLLILARVPISSGPFYINHIEVATPDQKDRNLANNALETIAIDQAATKQTFLPLLQRPSQRGIDLIVKSIILNADDTQVIIQNIGETELLPGNGFWVDLYINPNPPPTGVNQFPDIQNRGGVAWGVLDPHFSLSAGQEYMLHFGDSFYIASRSNFPDLIPAGSSIYVQVDAINLESDYGGVLEEHEIFNGPYNNISSITLTQTVSTAQWRLK